MAEIRGLASVANVRLAETLTSDSGSRGSPAEALSGMFDGMNTSQVAAVLNMTTRNVRDLAERGRLHGRKLSRGWVFDREIVAEFLEERA